MDDIFGPMDNEMPEEEPVSEVECYKCGAVAKKKEKLCKKPLAAPCAMQHV